MSTTFSQSMESSLASFQRTANERHQSFRFAFDITLNSFSTADSNRTNEAVAGLQKAAEAYTAILAQEDVPPWLKAILDVSRKYSLKPDATSAQNLLRTLAKYFCAIKPINFGARTAFDFDAEFDRLRNEQRLSDLFDALIDAVTTILESDELDSITVTKALYQVVDVLRVNRDGSYLAVRQSIFLARSIQNVVAAALTQVPGLNELLRGWEKAAGDVEAALDQMDAEFKADAKLSMHKSLPKLSRLAQIIDEQSLDNFEQDQTSRRRRPH